MLKNGILNPAINSLLSRVRHTNTIVIADRGFPSWPNLEIIDIALIDDLPKVLDVLKAVLAQFHVGQAFMAEEFAANNTQETQRAFASALGSVPLVTEPHRAFKQRVPLATGLIRTGDTTQYANIILESA